MYRNTSKRQKIRSLQGVAARERNRIANAEDISGWIDPEEDEIEIFVKRKLTGEEAHFVCTRGDRIDNYMVYCNGKYQGVQSITTLTKNIRKALPAFRQIS